MYRGDRARVRESLSLNESDKKVYIDRYGFRNEMNTERIGKTAKITPEVRIIVKETPLADNTKDLIRLSKFEPEQQAKIVEKISSGEAETINQARKVIASEQVKATPVVEGKYRVIYADPPWKYGGVSDRLPSCHQIGWISLLFENWFVPKFRLGKGGCTGGDRARVRETSL